MKKLLTLFLAALLLTSGCAPAEETPPEGQVGYDLYFREADLTSAAGQSALRAEQIFLPAETADEIGTQKTAEYLVQKLLEGPTDEGLRNTIPAGTSLLSLKLLGTRAWVDLSAEYERLSGVALTMADYALTLTLTQLPQIMSVRINVQGRELAYRDTQVLTPQAILLAPEGDILGTVVVQLYFVNEILELQAEERVLDLYEGDTQISAVVQALKEGPEGNGLFPAFPEDFRIGKVWLEDTVCYVNLSSALLESMEYTEGLSVTLQSLGKSLCSLDTVEEVRYLVDGEVADRYGSVDISEPCTEN